MFFVLYLPDMTLALAEALNPNKPKTKATKCESGRSSTAANNFLTSIFIACRAFSNK